MKIRTRSSSVTLRLFLCIKCIRVWTIRRSRNVFTFDYFCKTFFLGYMSRMVSLGWPRPARISCWGPAGSMGAEEIILCAFVHTCFPADEGHSEHSVSVQSVHSAHKGDTACRGCSKVHTVKVTVHKVHVRPRSVYMPQADRCAQRIWSRLC